MSAGEAAFVLAYVLAGAIAAACGLYLLVLAIAALFHRGSAEAGAAPSTRVIVLVPAHDEAALIARCVRSLREQDYPAGLHRVVVIADNCADGTAAIARAAGASVLVRDVPGVRGKGRALRWAIDRVLGEESAPDAIAIVDADAVAGPSFLRTLVRPLEAGAGAVQGESLLAEDGSSRTALRMAAFLLMNRVRPAGRAVLGLPCNLCGNGMLLARDVLVAHPWEAFTSAEDLEYTLQLRRAGVRPVFARGAILLSAAAPNRRAAAQQQLRWEGGKAHLARALVPGLAGQALRERRPLLLDAAFELALPPLGLLAAGALAGTSAGVALALSGVLPAAALAPWLLALASIPVYVLAGLRAADAPASAYRAMAQAPLFVLGKALHAHDRLRFRGDTWVRTERAGGDG
jgi:hypothetical protein